MGKVERFSVEVDPCEGFKYRVNSADGDCVDADVAQELYEALEQALFVITCCDETGYVDGEGFVDVDSITDYIMETLTKSRGEA